MPVSVADVRPGKCFLSQGAKPEVVRVLALRDGLVRYEVKGKRRDWTGRTELAVPEFIDRLVKEVGSDYEAAAPSRFNF